MLCSIHVNEEYQLPLREIEGGKFTSGLDADVCKL